MRTAFPLSGRRVFFSSLKVYALKLRTSKGLVGFKRMKIPSTKSGLSFKTPIFVQPNVLS